MKDGRQPDRWSRQAGVTLIELMIAIAILAVVSAGLLGVFSIAAGQNKQQGEWATRTTEYCQDKMEQLLALQFTDVSSNTTVWPTATTGGTGLGGSTASTTYGGTNLSSPVASYVDYLDVNGNLLGGGPPAPSGAFYVRVWQIQTDSTGYLKTITVVASTLTTAGFGGVAPSSTLVCLKACPGGQQPC
jgi:prepilin-type N-terminal cleavage/methylation domain-containing protein